MLKLILTLDEIVSKSYDKAVYTNLGAPAMQHYQHNNNSSIRLQVNPNTPKTGRINGKQRSSNHKPFPTINPHSETS